MKFNTPLNVRSNVGLQRGRTLAITNRIGGNRNDDYKINFDFIVLQFKQLRMDLFSPNQCLIKIKETGKCN